MSVRLLIGLSSAVYVMITLLFSRWTATLATIGAVGIAPLVLWIAAPEFLSIAQLEIPIAWARPAVLLVGGAIVVRYLATRSGRAGKQGRRTLAIVSAVLFWAGVAVTTGNWIVAVSVTIPSVVAAVALPVSGGATSEASSDEDRMQRLDQPDE